MDFAFILDPLPALKAYKDSSVAMMRALGERGHAIFALGAGGPPLGAGRHARAVRPLELFDDDHDWYRAGEAQLARLADFAAVMMRKDPPFDLEYLYATHLLELAEREGARVFNRPRAHPRPQREARDREVRASSRADARHARLSALARVHRRARRHHREAARRHGRHVDLPRARATIRTAT